MNKKILLSLTTLVVLGTGCSNKIPNAQPVKWQKDSALTINQEFLLTKEFKVPKDPILDKQNWTFQAHAEKQGKYLFKNEDISKIFLVGHNASEIILIGREDLINEYKNYFLENQVTANIKLQAVKPIHKDYNKVNILFFNTISK
ncbi:cag pathogenicity island Cag12 family protein [Arcobacter defluvii]|uniref:Cag pathogenicity island family protein n=1 Tax=Arcobacter defluvii TaxID=873191 RepID=A0AAE7E7Q1_9BACT|nr:cag pathogenicity island Cag12 family protein [Arcobacter defluvii]QKF77302.1 cag pathogenicity island family protein [Arcobacter defluvii]QKF77854.1 cag pathogenicity island family protein [Arcobacter defluvii]RXI29646.1 cag pathogenicity island protein [Arcobacter defluvii]